MKLAIFHTCQFVWVWFRMQVPCLYHWVYLFKYYILGMLWTPPSISSGLVCVSIVHNLLASSPRRNFWYNRIHLSVFPCKIKVMINDVLLLCVVIVYFKLDIYNFDLVWLQRLSFEWCSDSLSVDDRRNVKVETQQCLDAAPQELQSSRSLLLPLRR